MKLDQKCWPLGRDKGFLFSPLSKLTSFNIKNENKKMDISIVNSVFEIVFQVQKTPHNRNFANEAIFILQQRHLKYNFNILNLLPLSHFPGFSHI